MNALHHLDTPAVNPITMTVALMGLTEMVERIESEAAEREAKEKAIRDRFVIKQRARYDKKRCSDYSVNLAHETALLWEGVLKLLDTPMSSPDIGMVLNKNRASVYRYLIQMEKAGMVKHIGDGVDTLWVRVDNGSMD